jgi:hypothetical protein
MLRSTWKTVALVLLLRAGAALPATAQLIDGPASVDLGVNYTADISNAGPGVCGCFAMQGGGVNGRLRLTDRLSAVADFSVVNTGTVSGANYGLGLMTLMAGPQFRHRFGRYTPYGQFLLGAVRGFNSVFPASSISSASGFIYAVGGGSETVLTPKFSARLIEVDYMHSYLPNNSNNWQNHLKIAAGLIYHF